MQYGTCTIHLGLRVGFALSRAYWHSQQVHLLEWARAVIATTLGVLPSRALPPLMMQQEVDSVWDQICTSLFPWQHFSHVAWTLSQLLHVTQLLRAIGRIPGQSPDSLGFKVLDISRKLLECIA
jgi:hypothetical protein